MTQLPTCTPARATRRTNYAAANALVASTALDLLHVMLAVHSPALPTLARASGSLAAVLLSLAGRGGVIRDRCLRSLAAVVAAKSFALPGALASQLVAGPVRAEVLERSASLQSALSLLFAVISKRAQVPELYGIVGPVTDLMLNYALGRKALRQKCVVVLTRFLTEVPMTRDKFRSHVDLYLRSLRAYPDPGEQHALYPVVSTNIEPPKPTPVAGEAWNRTGDHEKYTAKAEVMERRK